MSRRARRKGKKRNTPPQKNKWFDFNKRPYILVLACLLIPLLWYIGVRVHEAEQTLISFSIVALIAGVIVEARRLSTNWKELFFDLQLSFLFSFLAFLPRKNDQYYDFEEKISSWPFYFILTFVLVSIVTHDKKITKRLNEGITLV